MYKENLPILSPHLMRTLKTLPGQFALHQFPLELLSLAIAPLSKVGFKVPWVAFATLDPPPMTGKNQPRREIDFFVSFKRQNVPKNPTPRNPHLIKHSQSTKRKSFSTKEIGGREE